MARSEGEKDKPNGVREKQVVFDEEKAPGQKDSKPILISLGSCMFRNTALLKNVKSPLPRAGYPLKEVFSQVEILTGDPPPAVGFWEACVCDTFSSNTTAPLW